MNETALIERIAALQSSELRNGAAALEIPYIHAKIIEYLAACNKYSDTPLALVEYLGQTKGSISQSLMKMEAKGLILKKPSDRDKRSVHLELTEKGHAYWKQLQAALPVIPPEYASTMLELRSLLQKLQLKHGRKGFSVCSSCRYNQQTGKNRFRCGLTGEGLTSEDVSKICREHEFAED